MKIAKSYFGSECHSAWYFSLTRRAPRREKNEKRNLWKTKIKCGLLHSLLLEFFSFLSFFMYIWIHDPRLPWINQQSILPQLFLPNKRKGNYSFCLNESIVHVIRCISICPLNWNSKISFSIFQVTILVEMKLLLSV